MFNEDLYYLSAGMLFIYSSIIFIVILIYRAIIFWKVYKKAGKNGWEAIIPFYNLWTLFEISGYPGYFMLLGLIPYFGFLVLFIFRILAAFSLAKKFGKNEAFAFFLLVLFPLIGYSILAFGNDKYNPNEGNKKETGRSEFANINSDDESDDIKYCSYCGTKNNINEKKCKKCKKELK